MKQIYFSSLEDEHVVGRQQEGIEGAIVEKGLAYSHFKNCKDVEPKPIETSWAGFCSRFSKHFEQKQKDGPAWSPTIYRQKTSRDDSHVLALTCGVFDFDHDVEPEEIFLR